jgi:hypothetical protein
VLDRTRNGGQMKGERHGQSKLQDPDIPEIFRLAEVGQSQQTIARKFGVCRQMISRILRGENWSHVAGHPAHSNAA